VLSQEIDWNAAELQSLSEAARTFLQVRAAWGEPTSRS
jgi:hypothetical protein